MRLGARAWRRARRLRGYPAAAADAACDTVSDILPSTDWTSIDSYKRVDSSPPVPSWTDCSTP